LSLVHAKRVRGPPLGARALTERVGGAADRNHGQRQHERAELPGTVATMRVGGALPAIGEIPVGCVAGCIHGSNSGLVQALIRGHNCHMQVLPISKVKDKLNEYVDSVAITHDQVTITKNGSPAAVLIGADEWESIQETLFWLSQPGIRETIAESEDDITAGRTRGEDEIRAEFGVPRHGS
jgi:antitoxin YefM